MVLSIGIDRAHPAQAAEAQQDLRAVEAGDLPPTSPVLPPWGTTPTSASAQVAHDGRHLLGAARAQQQRGLAPVPVAPLAGAGARAPPGSSVQPPSPTMAFSRSRVAGSGGRGMDRSHIIARAARAPPAMIHVTYSNRTEELLQALAAVVRQERAAAGPLGADRAGGPQPQHRDLRQAGPGRAARASRPTSRCPSCAGCWRGCASAWSRAPGWWTPARPRGTCWRCSHDEAFLEQPALAPVREYLLGAGPRPDVVDRRRCELAAQLARLFDEYAASRPGAAARLARPRTGAGRSPHAGRRPRPGSARCGWSCSGRRGGWRGSGRPASRRPS